MGNQQSGSGGGAGGGKKNEKEKKRYEPPIPTRVGKKRKKVKGPEAASKLPQAIKINFNFNSYFKKSFIEDFIFFTIFKIIFLFPNQVTPHTKCRLKLLKLERIKDYLLMEEEFIRNQVGFILFCFHLDFD